jgi:glycosyltransferase involved in cell wall biosynthesis
LSTVAVDLRSLVRAPTGIGIHTRELLVRLAPRGEQQFVGMAHAPLADPTPLAAAGVALETHPTFRGVAWQQVRLPRRLARGDIDLFWSPLMTLPWNTPVPSVVTVHDLTAVLYPETHRFKVIWSILPFLRRTVETATRVVTVSESAAADLRFHFPQCAQRLRVVPNGVDPGFVPASAEQVAATRERLGCPEGYLLYAGTIEPRKHVEVLAEAWAYLRDQDPKLPPLLLAGDPGWGAPGLRRRLRQLAPHGVRQLGRVDHPTLVELLQAASLFVYPSAYEGFGLPVLEAMACGVPVVTTTASSLPEVAGEAAVLVPPGEVPALAAAIRRLLDEPGQAAELVAAGLLQARRYPWERSADLLAEVLREARAAG